MCVMAWTTGHARDRKNEPRQDHRRQQRREQRHLERDLLGLRDRRDERALGLSAHQEQPDREQPSHHEPRIGNSNRSIAEKMIISADTNEIARYGSVLPMM